MEDGDGVDTTDHTDTDTGAVRRGPLRMEKVNQDQTLTLMLMLMPGTDITAIHGDMEDGDGVDTTDHTDTDTGAVRKGPLRMEKVNQDQMLTLTLMLMPGTDITAVHGDMEDGEGESGPNANPDADADAWYGYYGRPWGYGGWGWGGYYRPYGYGAYW